MVKRRWGFRYLKIRDTREIEFIIFGKPGRVMWNPRFDKKGEGTRSVFTISMDYRNYHYGILFQHYKQGYDFDSHKDGVPENIVFSVLLQKPKVGGEFFIDGPQRVWLNGLIRKFDGGRYNHGVSKIIEGSRTVLMFQRGRWRLT